MRFTVMDRRDDRVHLVSEDDDALYGHPSVYEEVWQAALTEVPPNWEIVDLSPPVPGGGGDDDGDVGRPPGLRMLASTNCSSPSWARDSSGARRSPS